MSTDFWESYGEAYRVFSTYCNHDDWCHILNRICDSVARINGKRSLSILDVGCGLGRNTLTIAESLFTRTGHRPVIDIVEPSQMARATARALIPSQQLGGFLRDEYTQLSDVGGSEYDAVIFLHSSYYIPEFEAQVERLLRENLREDGRLLFLVLPSSSAFFLGHDPLPNTAERIELILGDLGCSRKVQEFTSRFLFGSGDVILTAATVSLIKEFMMHSEMSDKDFNDLLVGKARGGEVDFADRLIVGHVP